ncbi:FecR family protein [Sunxiuqinia sp. A32]|uniref:FecR family protein n=1 Tax=Sunxiuqinia sp. A32 TaxID=3461496 RepID=UPI00404647A6
MKKDIFKKYLNEECSIGEFEQFIECVKEEEISRSDLSDIQEVWEEFDPDIKRINKEKYNALLDKIHHKINLSQNEVRLRTQKLSSKKRLLFLFNRAAAILFIPVLTLLLYTTFSGSGLFMKKMNNLEVQAPAGSRIKVDLSDGTVVWLNHGGKLKYPYRFGRKNRKVQLEGEAYFEVAHNSFNPFIVETNRVNIKATGTEFNVSAYSSDKLVETTLVEGTVILYEKKNNRQIKVLSPGECLKFDASKNAYLLETGNTKKYTAWKDGMLVFKNDAITEVAKKLARWYNIDVEITNERVKEFTYTATFTTETLSQVLELLTLATPVSYELTPSEKLLNGTFSKQKVQIGFKKH